MGIPGTDWENNSKWEDLACFSQRVPIWEDLRREAVFVEVIAACESRNADGKIGGAEGLGVVIRKRGIKLGLAQVRLAGTRRCSPRFVGELERGVAGGSVKQVIPACKMPEIDLFAKARGEQRGHIDMSWLLRLRIIR